MACSPAARRSACFVTTSLTNAVTVAMLGFARGGGGGPMALLPLTLFAIALTVAEVVMAVAIVLLLRRTRRFRPTLRRLLDSRRDSSAGRAELLGAVLIVVAPRAPGVSSRPRCPSSGAL